MIPRLTVTIIRKYPIIFVFHSIIQTNPPPHNRKKMLIHDNRRINIGFFIHQTTLLGTLLSF